MLKLYTLEKYFRKELSRHLRTSIYLPFLEHSIKQENCRHDLENSGTLNEWKSFNTLHEPEHSRRGLC